MAIPLATHTHAVGPWLPWNCIRNSRVPDRFESVTMNFSDRKDGARGRIVLADSLYARSYRGGLV